MTAWPLILGMGSAAATAGAVSVPAVRRIAFGSVNHDWLGHELEFDRVDQDGITVRCKSRTVMRAYRLGGIPYDTKPEAEQIALHQGRAEFLHFAASRKVIVRLFGVKRHLAVNHPAKWPSQALDEIGQAEADRFRDSYELRWFMTLQSPDLRHLAEVDERASSMLAGYKLARLARPVDPAEFCPLTGFLNFLACGDLRDDLRAPSSNISANIPASDLVFDRQSGTIYALQPTPTYYRVTSVQKWPDQVSGMLLHDLMSLPGEMEVSQVLTPTSKEIAVGLLKRRAKTPLVSATTVDECRAAAELLAEGNTSQVSTQFAVITRGASLEAVDALNTQVTRILAEASIAYAVATKDAPVVWFNRLPDRERLSRPLKLFSENIAALFPFESSPRGMDESLYGPAPIRSFATGSGQAYAFQFHNSAKKKALGHYAVFAPAGTGKTTLMLHLLSGLAKFDGVRSYIFDSQEGCRYMVEVMGGRYQSFDTLALNPLDVPNNFRNRHRLGLLVRSMLGDAGHEDGVEDLLSRAASIAFQLPIERRTFNEIFRLSFEKQTPAHKAFSRWVEDHKGREGQYAHVFNAPRDSLGGFLDQSFMTGINMNEALDDPVLGPPVVAHIANAIERIARSGTLRGFNLFVDEGGNLLRNPAFCEFVMVAYREYRKLGGSVGLAFQDPTALFKSGIAEAVLQNTATFFFFPNPSSGPADYAAFNLNEEQLRFIFSAPEGRKVLIVKRDAATGFNESVILDIDLAPLGSVTRFYDSGPDAVLRLQSIREQWGEEWLAKI